jgi:FAD/FMN-containing dehydrogenase
MKTLRRALVLILALLVIALLVVVGPPAVFLAWVWWHDPADSLPDAPPGTNDASWLNANQPAEVIPAAPDPAAAARQIADLVRRAATEGRHISISGARHSMGGHTLYPGALVLDMLPFRQMSLDVAHRLLRVGAGARWADVLPYLDEHGYSVAVMQSNNDFTVGGSLSVNCHGWQNNSAPIASTVESFRLVSADGAIRECSRTENPELFSLVLGGYGLWGVILDVQLRVVPNAYYRAEQHQVAPADYARTYASLTRGATDVGLAYGRISVAPDSFLNEAVITVFKTQPPGLPLEHTLTYQSPGEFVRLVFRGSVGSDYGKNLRWRLEKLVGGESSTLVSRNEILNEPADWYADRDPDSTEILHEYFVPEARLADFLAAIRPILLRDRPDLLNITVREVQTDHDSFLRYAREPVFGLVMLFHQRRDAAAEAAMQSFTREMIDAALASGGTYYLPYRPHATLDQFQRAYPMAAQFFALKERYDPAGIFQNEFYVNYGLPLLNSAAHP